MLGKLIKNEFKHSGRHILLIYGAVAVMIAILGVSMLSSATWLGAICCAILYVVGFASLVVTIVSVVKSFYETLYGQQGYLTLTLPVRSGMLVFAKALVAFVWVLSSFLVMAMTYLVIFFYAKGKTESIVDILLDSLAVSGMSELLPSASVIVQIIITVAIMVILTVISYVALVFFTVTAVNIRPLQSHPKIFGAIIIFSSFGVINSLGNTFTRYFPLTVNVTAEKLFLSLDKMGELKDVIFSYGLGGTIFSAFAGIVLLFFTSWLLEHKVNLK